MTACPIPNINGTSKTQLLSDLYAASEAVFKANQLVCQCAPHGRDYPMIDNEAYRSAIAEHHARVAALHTIYGELEFIARSVEASEGGWPHD